MNESNPVSASMVVNPKDAKPARRVTRQARWRRAEQSVLAQAHLSAEPADLWNSIRAFCRQIRHLERENAYGSEVWIDNLRMIVCAEIIAWKRARERKAA